MKARSVRGPQGALNRRAAQPLRGLADPALLSPAPRRRAPDRLVALAAGMLRSNSSLSLRAIAAELEALRERPPRGGHHWAVSSVAHLLARARKAGLLHDVGT